MASYGSGKRSVSSLSSHGWILALLTTLGLHATCVISAGHPTASTSTESGADPSQVRDGSCSGRGSQVLSSQSSSRPVNQ